MAARSPEFSEFRSRSRLQQLRCRSRSAATVNVNVNRQPETITNDDDDSEEWDQRRRSANTVQLSRISNWLQKRVVTALGRPSPVADGEGPRKPVSATASAPLERSPNVDSGGGGVDRSLSAHDDDDAAATSSAVSVHLTTSTTPDCKCVSCPELVDAPCRVVSSGNEQVPVGVQSADQPSRHSTVRKTHSDLGFQPAAESSSSAEVRRPLLSIPSVFVTSYTRSVETRPSSEQCQSHYHHHHYHQQQQQQQEERRSVSAAKQRLMSMSDSRLGDGRHQNASTKPPLTAKIWKLTEFLCIGNAAAAGNDRLLCRQSIFGLVDLCVAAPALAAAAASRSDPDRWAPCTCGDRRRHRRSALRLDVSRTDLTDVCSCFPTINRFVDGFRRRRGDAWTTSARPGATSPLPIGSVMIFCETGDTVSVLAASQYLVAVEGLSVDQVERSLAAAGCVTPLVAAFNCILQSISDEQRQRRQQQQEREQQARQQVEGSVHVETDQVAKQTKKSSRPRRRPLPRHLSESMILAGMSAHPVDVKAWPDTG